MARTPARRPRGHPPIATTLRTPLSRWGFALLAVLAASSGQTGPFLVTATLAAYAWKHR